MIDSNALIVYREIRFDKMYIKEDARKRRELNVNFSIICRPACALYSQRSVNHQTKSRGTRPA